MKDEQNKNKENVHDEHKEHLRLKKNYKNRLKKQIEDQDLEDMLEELDAETYEIVKKIK